MKNKVAGDTKRSLSLWLWLGRIMLIIRTCGAPGGKLTGLGLWFPWRLARLASKQSGVNYSP